MIRFQLRKQMLHVEALEERWVPSSFKILGTLGGPSSMAYAVNGYAVGQADTDNGATNAMLWSPGLGLDINLGTLGGPNSAARAINGNGQVVGWSNDEREADMPVAFIWDLEHGMQSLGIDGVAYGINDAGTVVGQTAVGEAFVWDQSTMATLEVPDGASRASAINNAGTVVGWTETDWNPYAGQYIAASAFVWQGSAVTDLGKLPDDNRSEAHAVNAAGQVVGRSGQHICDGKGCAWLSSHAFLWQEGMGMIDIGSLGGDFDDTAALAINSQGTVVGTSNGHAFLYTGGPLGFMIDLDGLLPDGAEATFNVATGISDDGWVVGYGTSNGETRGFLMFLGDESGLGTGSSGPEATLAASPLPLAPSSDTASIGVTSGPASEHFAAPIPESNVLPDTELTTSAPHAVLEHVSAAVPDGLDGDPFALTLTGL